MYNIFFEDRRLAVCSPEEQPLNDPEAILYSPGSFPELAELPKLFYSTPNISKLFVPSVSQEGTFKQICTGLNRINAGGGVVTNRDGLFLLIFRYGRWDLPKGTQEPNEDIRTSALREVQEECGLDGDVLEIGGHICDTYHSFRRDGKYNLKCTRWYKMEYSSNVLDTVPQISEHIEKAVWVKREELPEYLATTYPSILEVFNLATGGL